MAEESGSLCSGRPVTRHSGHRRASLTPDAWLPCRCPCLATRRGGGQRQLLHVGPARVLSTAGTLTLGEEAVGIYLALEPRQESLATRFCARSAVSRPRPRDVGTNSAPLRWRAHRQHHNGDADHLCAAMPSEPVYFRPFRRGAALRALCVGYRCEVMTGRMSRPAGRGNVSRAFLASLFGCGPEIGPGLAEGGDPWSLFTAAATPCSPGNREIRAGMTVLLAVRADLALSATSRGGAA
jgi:hypothetical protein